MQDMGRRGLLGGEDLELGHNLLQMQSVDTYRWGICWLAGWEEDGARCSLGGCQCRVR